MALAFDKLAYSQEFGFCLGATLQHIYCRKFDVTQRGFGGYNSHYELIMIHKIIQHETTKAKIKLMVVFFGTSDSVVPEAVQQVPIPRCKDKLKKNTRQYCDAAIEVAIELNVAVVPLWYLIMADLGWKGGDPVYGLAELPAENPLTTYLNDGLHYFGKDYMVEFTNVVKAIEEFYPELDAHKVVEKLPPWDKLSSPNVLKAPLE
ncbi:hypothetical protein V1505DRAFT_400448 [Lipomyces doorenjongii]